MPPDFVDLDLTRLNQAPGSGGERRRRRHRPQQAPGAADAAADPPERKPGQRIVRVTVISLADRVALPRLSGTRARHVAGRLDRHGRAGSFIDANGVITSGTMSSRMA
jgi:hypothetical protein